MTDRLDTVAEPGKLGALPDQRPISTIATVSPTPQGVERSQMPPAQIQDSGQQAWGGSPTGPYDSSLQMNSHISTTVNVGGPNIVIAQRNNGPGLFVRIVWFFFIGSWIGPLTLAVAYLLLIPIITIPVSMGLFNRIPQVMTLRPRNTTYRLSHSGDVTAVTEQTQEQVAWYWRFLYFIFIGSWVALLWFTLAEAIAIFTLGLALPLSFWMFNRVGAVATLYRT